MWGTMPRHSKDARDASTRSETESSSQAERLRRRKYAEAIARAEFGRHYWNERLDKDLREALDRRPPRRKT
jgi:hypothetical protein